MQKWEKFLLASLFILAILGCLLGFAITKTGIGEVKVLADIDLFGLIELILLIIVVICTIFDIYETYEIKNQFCNTEFKVIMNTKNRFRNILIFLVLLSVFELGTFLKSIDMYMLPLFFITLILTYMFAFHNKLANCINDNGILYWGIYYSWEDVKSYKIKNQILLEMNIINNFFSFEYNNIIKLNFAEEDKAAIEEFITKKLYSVNLGEKLDINIDIDMNTNKEHASENPEEATILQK